jgi:transglutaminase-like putative cysteine protease
MDFRETRACKIISAVVLFFFCWSFAGLRDVAYAASRPGMLRTPQVMKRAVPAMGQMMETAAAMQATSPAKRLEDRLKALRALLADEGVSMPDGLRNMGQLRRELAVIDREMRAEMRATEADLRARGLSDTVMQRHAKFVEHYESNWAELTRNLNAVATSNNAGAYRSNAGKALGHLNRVRPPKRHVPLDPNNLPHRAVKEQPAQVEDFTPPKLIKFTPISQGLYADPIQIASAGDITGLLTSTVIDATVPPTSADLAETVEIQFTTAIANKAADLGHNPVAIYNWVRNNIEFEPYYGSLKGARQTLMERAGNDYDQASLLIALLRASGVHARYARGTITMPIEQAMNWVGGAKSPEIAGSIFSTNSVPATLLREGATIKRLRLEHVWVEAWVDMIPSMGAVHRQGDTWTPIDPSYKRLYVQEGRNIAAELPFDEEAYLSHVTEMPPLAEYLTQLDEYYTAVYNGFFFDALHAIAIMPEEHGIFAGTLPYEADYRSAARFSSVPAAMRHTIGLGLVDATGELVSVTKPLAEIAGRMVTLGYRPATEADRALMESYGGLLNTPAYLMGVVPEIRVDDAAVLEGGAMTLGSELKLRTDLDGPAANWGRAVHTKDVTYGLHFAIGIAALDYPGQEMHEQSVRLLDMSGSVLDSMNALDGQQGDVLQNMVMEYFGEFMIFNRAIQSITGVHDTKIPSIATISTSITYDRAFGVAVSPPDMRGYTTDAYHIMSAPLSYTGDADAQRIYLEHSGLASSYLEHRTAEKLLPVESVSAVKLIQIASEQGVPMLTLNSSNADVLLPTLQISESDRTLIADSINAGQEVTVPAEEITYYGFTGLGMIVRDPQSGAGAYLISEGYHGGAVVACKNPETGKTDIGKACHGVAGSYMRGAIALVVAGPPNDDFRDRISAFFFSYDVDATLAAIMFTGHFAVHLLEGVSKGTTLGHIADPDLVVFYYSGHGTPMALKVASAATAKESNIDFTEIKDIRENVDSILKLVFLNGCQTSWNAEGSTTNAFMDVLSPDALVGFDCKIYWNEAALAGLNFWMVLKQGVSIQEAVGMVNAKLTMACPLTVITGNEPVYLW